MAKGILGRKLGMTQIFSENGVLVPVTVIDVLDNVVLQQKTKENDGYVATQIGFSEKREKLATNPELGHAKKAGTTPKRFVREIRFNTENELSSLALGAAILPSIFSEGEIVDVTGTSKGHGFEGSIKRHGQSRGPMTHGSRYHRRPGSMGPIKGKLKGKKLPGHMGVDTITIQNLKIVRVDLDNNLLIVSGGIPGAKNSYVVIRSAVKGN
jgi:large subunit ribosomal protein L3